MAPRMTPHAGFNRSPFAKPLQGVSIVMVCRDIGAFPIARLLRGENRVPAMGWSRIAVCQAKHSLISSTILAVRL